MGCPIRISTDQWLFAPPRGLSQLITSFFALESLGIPHTLLVTFFFLIPRFFFFSILWFDSIFPACQRTYAFITVNTVTAAWWYQGSRTPYNRHLPYHTQSCYFLMNSFLFSGFRIKSNCFHFTFLLPFAFLIFNFAFFSVENKGVEPLTSRMQI